MHRNLIHRAFSFCLAAFLTAVVLGGIDGLAQPDAQHAQLAHVSAPRA